MKFAPAAFVVPSRIRAIAVPGRPAPRHAPAVLRRGLAADARLHQGGRASGDRRQPDLLHPQRRLSRAPAGDRRAGRQAPRGRGRPDARGRGHRQRDGGPAPGLPGDRRPGDSAVVLTPLWPNVAAAIRVAGAEAIEVPLALTDDGFRLDFDRIEAAIKPNTRLLALASPGNPTAWTATARRLAKARRPLRASRPLAPRRRRLRADRLRRHGRPEPAVDPGSPRPDDHRPELLEGLPDDRLEGRLRDRPARAGPGDDPPPGVRRQPRPRRSRRRPRGSRSSKASRSSSRARPATPGTARSPSTDSGRWPGSPSPSPPGPSTSSPASKAWPTPFDFCRWLVRRERRRPRPGQRLRPRRRRPHPPLLRRRGGDPGGGPRPARRGLGRIPPTLSNRPIGFVRIVRVADPGLIHDCPLVDERSGRGGGSSATSFPPHLATLAQKYINNRNFTASDRSSDEPGAHWPARAPSGGRALLAARGTFGDQVRRAGGTSRRSAVAGRSGSGRRAGGRRNRRVRRSTSRPSASSRPV